MSRSVTFLSVGLGHGGAETQILRVATALRLRGWDVGAVSILPGGALVPELERGGVRCASLEAHGADPRAAMRLLRVLRQWKPEVLATFMFHANVVGRVAGRLARVPVVVSSVRSDNFGGDLRYRLLGATDRLADATVANSQIVADGLARRGVVSPDRLLRIPNAIPEPGSLPSSDERAALRAELGAAPDDFLWLAIGNLSRWKDYPVLLRAVARLRDAGVRGVVRIVGHGELEGELRALAASLDIEDRVRFVGFRADAARLAYAADGFVMSSHTEGMPNALMEALLAGTPAVATRVGGIPELVRDGEMGFLVPPGDPEAFADGMRRLAELAPEERATMGRAGREHVAAAHRYESVVDQWEGLFLKLMAQRGRSAARLPGIALEVGDERR